MKHLIQYWFYSAVDFTECHFDGLWQLFIAATAVFIGLCVIFL